MATIRNFIELQDGTSPVLDRIINRANSVAERFERLAGAAGRAGREAETASSRFGMLQNIFAGNLMADLAMRGIEMVKESIVGLIGTAEEYSRIQASLNLVSGSQQNAAYLNEQIFQSAQRARGGYLEMASAVSQLSMSAKDAFPDPREAVDFMEGIQKLFVVGGASKENQKFAMLQLTQGMASGQLQGDEFRSIAENAPIIENMIAKTMGVSRGELKKLSSQGEITADIIKRSILENMDEINAQFMQMPMKWGDLTSIAANSILHSFQPVFNRLTGLANSPGVKRFFAIIVELAQATAPFFYNLVGIAGWTINTVVSVFDTGMNFVRNNMWLVYTALSAAGLAMLFFGLRSLVTAGQIGAAAVATGIKTVVDWAETAAILAMTVAQDGLNAALAMCPITWIIGLVVLLIAVVYAVVAAINYFAGTSISATGIIFGAFAWLGAMIGNIVITAWNLFASFGNFLANVFNNPLAATYNLFSDIWNGIVDLVKSAVNGIIDLINKIPGLDKIKKGGFEHVTWNGLTAKRIEYDELKPFSKAELLDVGTAATTGYKVGENLQNTVLNIMNPNTMKLPDIPTSYDASKNADSQRKDIADAGKQTAKNTGKMADAIEMTADEIKEMRDVATQQAVMKWQEKNIIINMTNNNTVNSGVDIDGMNTDLLNGLRSAFNELEEGGGGI